MKYRKKPIVIEAQKLTVENMTALAAWCRGSIKGERLPAEERVIDINTLEGEMRANVGDYIIRGIKGEFYPCKAEIFEASYEDAAAGADPAELERDKKRLDWMGQMRDDCEGHVLTRVFMPSTKTFRESIDAIMRLNGA